MWRTFWSNFVKIQWTEIKIHWNEGNTHKNKPHVFGPLKICTVFTPYWSCCQWSHTATGHNYRISTPLIIFFDCSRNLFPYFSHSITHLVIFLLQNFYINNSYNWIRAQNSNFEKFCSWRTSICLVLQCDVTGVFNEFCHQNYQFCLHETNKWSDHYLSGKPAN